MTWKSIRTMLPVALAVAISSPAQAGEIRQTLDSYCVSCHNQRLKSGGLVLEEIDTDHVAANAETWEKVIRKLMTGAMPPAGARRPEADVRARLIGDLEHSLDAAGAAVPNPGRPVPHRLNRAEYRNAIRDLLALDLDVASLLPADESGYGFDNIGDVLGMSPGLIERYLLAARKISRLAIGDPSIKPSIETYALPYLTLTQTDRLTDEQPHGTRGGTAVRHLFPLDGDYTFKLRLQRNALALGNTIRGLDEESLIELRIDGVRVKTFSVGGPTVKPVDKYDPAYATSKVRVADEALEAKVHVEAGPHVVTVSFVKQTWMVEGVGPSRLPPASDGFAAAVNSSPANGKVESTLDTLAISGPFDGVAPRHSPTRQRLFVCQPPPGAASRTTATSADDGCARKILTAVARRAFRHPVTPAQVDELFAVFAGGRREGGFDTGVQYVLERILADPDFLVRVEEDPRGVKPGIAYRVPDLVLASRLSFFLWSSIPDDELLNLAERGALHEPAVLEPQVRRMLGDAKASALVDNFFGQWLTVRKVSAQRPDPKVFPEFDENLRTAFQRETQLFLQSQVQEDRPALDLLTANYTFVNERLARHYGMPNVYGTHFRRVTYADDRRAGILGQGSVLMATSYAHRTSPVLRGAWLLANILGTPPPPPPANVPPFPESDGKSAPKSVRERMEQHRRNPVCAACHSQMDPLGFALENFDAVGKWRSTDGTATIDASGTFPGGAVKFSGPSELRQGILQYKDAFLQTLTQKLLTYALGRGAEYRDMPAVRAIVRDAAQGDYRWSALIMGVVKSTPFQMRTSK